MQRQAQSPPPPPRTPRPETSSNTHIHLTLPSSMTFFPLAPPPAPMSRRPALPTCLCYISTTISPTPCGNSSVYCPPRVSTPTFVSAGNYSLGGTSAAGRVAEAVCPKGRYCTQGKAILCPAGTFGEREGLQNSTCSGPCPAGENSKFRGVAERRLMVLGYLTPCSAPSRRTKLVQKSLLRTAVGKGCACVANRVLRNAQSIFLSLHFRGRPS